MQQHHRTCPASKKWNSTRRRRGPWRNLWHEAAPLLPTPYVWNTWQPRLGDIFSTVFSCSCKRLVDPREMDGTEDSVAQICEALQSKRRRCQLGADCSEQNPIACQIQLTPLLPRKKQQLRASRHVTRNDHPIQTCWKWSIGFWFCNAVSSYIVRFPPEKAFAPTLIYLAQSYLPLFNLYLLVCAAKPAICVGILSLHDWLCRQHVRASRRKHFSKLWLQIAKTMRHSPLHRESCKNACSPWLTTRQKTWSVWTRMSSTVMPRPSQPAAGPADLQPMEQIYRMHLAENRPPRWRLLRVAEWTGASGDARRAAGCLYAPNQSQRVTECPQKPAMLALASLLRHSEDSPARRSSWYAPTCAAGP